MKHGKKYSESAKLVEHLKLYDTAEALDLCTKTGKAKFDETVEVHVRLGVDSRHADQQVRGAVVLPNGTGKKVRVAVFAKADKAQAALDAGAEIVGAEDLMERIQKAGTVTPDVAKAVQEAKAGKIEYRLDKTNIIHCPIGKVSFGVEKLQQNFDTLLGAIVKAKPAAAKGQYVKSCVVATTMGPGIKINPGRFI